jgi:phage/plasmid primase-like uncharacterized protein
MVDLTPYQNQIKRASEKSFSTNSFESRSLFLDHLHLIGYRVDGGLQDGEIVRVQTDGDKGTKKSGWYIFYQNETVGVGVYGSWKNPEEKNVWYSRNESDLTFKERIQINEQIKAAQEKQKRQMQERQEESAKEAADIYNSLPDATDKNPYIAKKKVKVYEGLRADQDKLIIPVIYEDTISSLQTIYPNSDKRFKSGGKTKGCYFKVKHPNAKDDIVYLAEGYATAASIVEATTNQDGLGNSCYIAFSAHNLYEVAAQLKHKYGKVILCGDNDDTCFAKAKQIEQGLAIETIFPPKEHNDFNDWWVFNPEEVKGFFNKKPKAKKVEPVKEGVDFNFGGVLQDIVDYYNATAKREQPLFAIQAAIATCSVILGRNFETNKENRTSLFLMNIAKSGTGKEHAKKVVEKILEATENEELISGDGYTSQSAVISACQERPRHITIIDEFSKYLQASQNKHSGGHLAEANAALMQAIGRLEGKLRAKARATIGMSAAHKKELQNQYVINPAITLLSMTTPDDFFNTINIDAIKDGFINRFIICISDAERALPNEKEPLEVPDSIINWAGKIRERRGQSDESPVLEPKIITIPFNFDCNAVQAEFHKYCLECANKNERFGLSEISGRSAEMAYRLALIIALSENPNAERVQAHHMEKAIAWVKFNLERLIANLKMHVSTSMHEANKKEVLNALRQAKDGVTKSAMFKRPPFSKYERKVLDNILSELAEAELITDEVENKEGAGRRAVVWKAM